MFYFYGNNRINTKPVDVLKDNTKINWEAICNDVWYFSYFHSFDLRSLRLKRLKWQHVHQDVQLRRKAPLFEHQHQLLGNPKLQWDNARQAHSVQQDNQEPRKSIKCKIWMTV